MSTTYQNNHQTGARGEEIALNHYLEKGYSLISKNLQYYMQGTQGRLGEVDLVLKKDNIIVFVEVKARNNQKFGLGVEQITQKKLKCIWKTYQYFLKKNPQMRKYFHRFDIAWLEKEKLQIFENAYSFDRLSSL